MDKTGRIVGMTVFILGIIILIFVFAIAYSMFTSPVPGLADSGTGSNSSITAGGLGSILTSMVVRISLLFIMTLAGSLIASRGIYLYIGSKQRIVDDNPEDV